MRYKIGDVAWYKKTECKCTIQEVHHKHYDISYIKGGIVRQTKVTPDELTDYLVVCPICQRNNRVINGLVDFHPKEGLPCYGSYLPQR